MDPQVSTAHRDGAVALLEAANVTKAFPGVRALRDVRVAVAAGEVIGLAGENGSGKSTLLRVLAGLQAADDGEVRLDGAPLRAGDSSLARRSGIALVAQEVSVQGHLTVTENLLDGALPRNALGLIRWRDAHAGAAAALADLGVEVDPRALVRDLPLNTQQLLSVARVVLAAPRVALFDEVTSSLTREQTAVVHRLVARMSEAGTAVVYISHRLHEYLEITSRVVVLKDGELVADRATSSLTEDELVTLMVGRALDDIFARPTDRVAPTAAAPVALRVTGLSTARLHDVCIDVRRGEILGICGQAGSGRSSLAQTLMGQWPYTGTVEVDGRAVSPRSARAAVRAGIALVTEDRKRSGLVLSMSVQENIALPSWGRRAPFARRDGRRERAVADRMLAALRIKAPHSSVEVRSLSGGNQQKVVLSKWISCDPSVLIVDEPTRGVDVGAKAEIYGILDGLAASGMAVVVVSSEMLELLRLSDRIVVMAAGRTTGEQPGATATEESLAELAFRR